MSRSSFFWILFAYRDPLTCANLSTWQLLGMQQHGSAPEVEIGQELLAVHRPASVSCHFQGLFLGFCFHSFTERRSFIASQQRGKELFQTERIAVVLSLLKTQQCLQNYRKTSKEIIWLILFFNKWTHYWHWEKSHHKKRKTEIFGSFGKY